MIDIVTLDELRETRRRLSAEAGNDVRRYAEMFLTPTDNGNRLPLEVPGNQDLAPTETARAFTQPTDV